MTRALGRAVAVGIVLGAALLGVGCKARHFECESHPQLGGSERGCLPSDVTHEALCKGGGGCFSQDTAYCFFASRSRLDMYARGTPLPDGTGNWSPTETGQDCFASLPECVSFRNGFGTGKFGQPPVKTECIAVTAKEATKDP